MTTPEEVAARGTIVRALAGSTVHGLNLPGSDDRDELGICVEPPEYVTGLRRFEQYVFRTQPEGVRSGPGDLDLTVYGLQKFARLALKGNPTILLLFFVPDSECSILTGWGRTLRASSNLFLSRQVAAPFLGYMQAQRQRLLGERGQMRVKRPELIEAHGYDTKYAAHVVRLGYQGVELLTTGRLTLPIPEPTRSRILAVRRGEVDFNDALTLSGELEEELMDVRDSGPLPEKPDFETIDRLLHDIYQDVWHVGI